MPKRKGHPEMGCRPHDGVAPSSFEHYCCPGEVFVSLAAHLASLCDRYPRAPGERQGHHVVVAVGCCLLEEPTQLLVSLPVAFFATFSGVAHEPIEPRTHDLGPLVAGALLDQCPEVLGASRQVALKRPSLGAKPFVLLRPGGAPRFLCPSRALCSGRLWSGYGRLLQVLGARTSVIGVAGRLL